MKKIRSRLYSLILPFICAHSLLGQESEVESQFHIEVSKSGIDYPTKGDESIDVQYEDLVFHVRIYHPKVIEGGHFSTPFFWVSEEGKKNSHGGIVAVPPHIGGLSWHSINGYFFAEKKGALRGFFLEDGFDNADSGSSGLIFLNEKGKSSAWRWSYVREADKKKGSYVVVDVNDAKKVAPATLLKRLAHILDHAEVQADYWPGP